MSVPNKITAAFSALKVRLGVFGTRRGVIALFVVIVLTLGSLGAGLALGTWRNICYDCPSIAQIYAWEPTQSTKIFSHDGQLLAELGLERRTQVAIEDLPEYVPQAFVAVEDKRFYDHNGFDIRGIARAAVRLITERRIAGGGSTITQQLARHMFQQQLGFRQDFSRKLKELRVALELETVYTKDQILQAYINQINYGRGRYGIESASQWFYGKPATELNVAEAALLAAVINIPEHYSPFAHPERAKRRRDMVIGLMARQGFIPEADVERWRAVPIPETEHTIEDNNIAPYFVEMVRRELDTRYGSDLYRRGYRVYTTLDIEMQRRAVEAMEQGWANIEAQPAFRAPRYEDVINDRVDGRGRAESPYIQGMFIAMEAGTGEIRALIGGRDFNDSKFNRATQARRQPGSVFKPFVYGAAISSRIPASHIIYDAPLMIDQPDGSFWAPRNFGETFNGPTTLREALRRSINVVTVKLAQEVGIETVVQFARRAGIETPIPPVLASSIGAGEVTPLEVIEAYSVFATQGTRTRSRTILRVEDTEGRVLWETRPDREQVIDPQTSAIVNTMLQDVVNRGTGYTAIRGSGKLPYDVPAAGKTGTTNDNTDIWFVGYTPDLLAAVWFGFDRPATIVPRATGGGYAAPVWGDFMNSVYIGETALRPIPEPWEIPPGVTAREIDPTSGRLAADWCMTETVYTEYFIPGTEPTEACELDGGGLFGAPLRGFEMMQPGTVPDEPPTIPITRDSMPPDPSRH